METSQKRIEANRANAQRSTGPQSRAGRVRSALNAVKHGLFCRQVLMEWEDPLVFRAFRLNLREELAAVGPVEEMLADRIVSEAWRLQRIVRIEREWMDQAMEQQLQRHDDLAEYADQPVRLGDGIAPAFDGVRLERLRRYETRIEGSMYRAIHELELLQARRRAGRPAFQGHGELDRFSPGDLPDTMRPVIDDPVDVQIRQRRIEEDQRQYRRQQAKKLARMAGKQGPGTGDQGPGTREQGKGNREQAEGTRLRQGYAGQVRQKAAGDGRQAGPFAEPAPGRGGAMAEPAVPAAPADDRPEGTGAPGQNEPTPTPETSMPRSSI